MSSAPRRPRTTALAVLAVGALTVLPATTAASSAAPSSAPAAAASASSERATADRPASAERKLKKGRFKLTILHNNDGESQLINAPASEDFGGVARFKTLTDALKDKADKGGRSEAIMLSSGDNFLAGPRFDASLQTGVPFYDSIALDAIGYDAIAVGNHEFDFGPDVLADFIEGFGTNPANRTPFVSANLNVVNEPRLAALAKDGTLVKSTVVTKDGFRIGVVGATTPLLPAISSPRNVEAREDVAGIVQTQVDRLGRRGVDKVILISHLQNINEDRALVPMLSGVDVVIAGGGDELLANPGDPLVPGDSVSLDSETGEPLTYPILAEDADGSTVPIVTTAGDYKYVGRLVVVFDKRGNVKNVRKSSGPVRVSGIEDDAVAADPVLLNRVVDPVRAYIDALAENVIGQSEVGLDGRRDPGVRTMETNLGNLLADALLSSGQDRAADFGVDAPQVAIQTSGGIRNNNVIPFGPVTELDTFNIAAFANFVAVVPDVPRAQFKEILENAVSRIPAADGRFPQIAGFSFTYDPSGTAQVVENDGTVVTPGSRIQDVTLDDGTPIVVAGVVVPGDPIDVAANDFTARGGDQYPFRGLPFTTVGVTYQQALANFVADELGGQVTAADYPEGGEGRITRLP